MSANSADQMLTLILSIAALVVIIHIFLKWHGLYWWGPSSTTGPLNKAKVCQKSQLPQRLIPAKTAQDRLDGYFTESTNKKYLGLKYERYIGYLLEQQGWNVEFRGAQRGLRDRGIDLVARKPGEINLIQCKLWSKTRVIRENTVHQLHGSAEAWKQRNQHQGIVVPVLYCCHEPSLEALKDANSLGVQIASDIPLKPYPLIKCNINPSNGAKFYHLPWDPQYDSTKILPSRGESYTHTIEEAETKGFKRAGSK